MGGIGFTGVLRGGLKCAASSQPPFRTDMLRWELAKGACPSATDDVLVHLPSRARPNQW